MIPLIWILSKAVQFIDTESAKVVGVKGWILQDEIVLEIGCPKIWIYLINWNVHLKNRWGAKFLNYVFCYSWKLKKNTPKPLKKVKKLNNLLLPTKLSPLFISLFVYCLYALQCFAYFNLFYFFTKRLNLLIFARVWCIVALAEYGSQNYLQDAHDSEALLESPVGSMKHEDVNGMEALMNQWNATANRTDSFSEKPYRQKLAC